MSARKERPRQIRTLKNRIKMAKKGLRIRLRKIARQKREADVLRSYYK